nr:S9 family peptidase [Saprospiraceae bacterium]
MKIFRSLFVLAIFIFFSCGEEKKGSDFTPIELSYPDTHMDEIIDDYHGISIADPFRWLEEDTAALVKEWVISQNEVTFGYLKQLPGREAISNRLNELMNYPRYSAPRKIGDYYLFSKNDGLQNQAVIYKKKGLYGDPVVFIDPNELSEEGLISINLLGKSPDNKFVAYSQQEAGSDWVTIGVYEVATGEKLEDELNWVKFSGASWDENGFYYSRYPEPESGMELSANNQFHAVYYHKLGTPQSEDLLVYEDRDRPYMYHFTYLTDDQEYVIMHAAPGTDGYATYFKPNHTDDMEFQLLFPGYSNKSSVVAHDTGRFLVHTDIHASNYRLISVDPYKNDPSDWIEVIPESDHLLRSVATGGGKLFANYLENAMSKVMMMNYDGSETTAIELPGTGTASGFSGTVDQDQLFYTFSSFLYPSTVFSLDISTAESSEFFESELRFDPEDFEEKQVFYESKDGTRVPMFIVHKKGLELDGSNPTMLYSYGGFNISLTPSFSASNIVLLENGGVYAMANIRGGGEFGEEWHKAGMLENKQNVFDDFIAAAEYLIEKRYTREDKLGIIGGSNGGLLVAACKVQRPDLFSVVIPRVGVLDMLRYHLFTVGKGWIPEYGSSDDPEQFKFLYAYSPLHNLEAGTEYPATLIMTADHDDRVVPAHSFKYAAELQRVHSGPNPVLIRIDTDAGHGAGKPISKIIEEQTDIWTFFFFNTQTELAQ